jgi:hypothetical protein
MTRRDVGTVRGQAHVAQHLQRTQQHRQRRSAGRDAREMRRGHIRSRIFDETRHQPVMVLGGDAAEQVSQLQVGARIALEPGSA